MKTAGFFLLIIAGAMAAEYVIIFLARIMGLSGWGFMAFVTALPAGLLGYSAWFFLTRINGKGESHE